MALKVDGEQLAVAFGDPPSDEDLQSLTRSGHRVTPVLADPTVIIAMLTSPAPPPPARRTPPRAQPPRRRTLGVDARTRRTMHQRQDAPFVSAGEGIPLHIDDLLRYAVSVAPPTST